MASRNPGPSSQLNAGSPQPTYGSFRPNNTPSHGPSHSPPPYTRLFAAPGPTSSQSPALPPQPKKRTSLVTCLMIVFFQAICILVVYRSDALASYIDLESGARRASMEASALVAEREKWEQEQENMKHDREMWEKGKIPKDRVPLHAYWISVQPVGDCRAYGKREYRGVLRNVPNSWSIVDACMNTPVSIRVWKLPDVEIRQPYRCVLTDGPLYGYWIVDWGQDDCKPKLEDVHDTGCTNYRSGLTRIEAQVVDIDSKKQDWRVM